MHRFALLAGWEGVVRGLLISVFPVALYNSHGSAAIVSLIYFLIGLASLCTGLLVPFAQRFIPRRWVYICGACLYILGTALGAVGGTVPLTAGLACTTIATVITFNCFNAYVLDYIARIELTRSESLRMFYSALGWSVGPVAGVFLMGMWPPLPFLLSCLAACGLLGTFLFMRLGNGKLITRARAPAPNPFAYFARFFAQPRLVAGWLFAVIRSCGWWAYVVYLPIFAVESGLGHTLGGLLLSLTNGALFFTPFMLRWMKANSVRHAVRSGFFISASFFAAASVFAFFPPVAAALLFVGSFFLILLDISAGLPFLMAVKPSERTEMSAIYSSYRDVSGTLTPGIAWVVLLALPLWGIFLAASAALFTAWGIAGRLHPRLGTRRLPAASAAQTAAQ
nr:MFS transporter [Aquicoccus sp. G2-2]MEA1115043.1 MFS transporter [Aquicoccus sp. G2-2]